MSYRTLGFTGLRVSAMQNRYSAAYREPERNRLTEKAG